MNTKCGAHPVSRSPTGCNAKPIYLALTPAERAQVERMARAEQRTLSATARLLVLRGIEADAARPESA